jgi:hypothetical protein
MVSRQQRSSKVYPVRTDDNATPRHEIFDI